MRCKPAISNTLRCYFNSNVFRIRDESRGRKIHRATRSATHATISRREIPADPRKWESREGCVNYLRAYKIFARPRNLDARTRPTPIKPVGRQASIRQRWIIQRPQASIVSGATPRRCHEKCIASAYDATRTGRVDPPTVSEICDPGACTQTAD